MSDSTSKKSKLIAPELGRHDLNEPAVREFARDFASYRGRGGKERVRDGIAPSTLRVIAAMGVDVDTTEGTNKENAVDDTKFLKALLAQFAPPTVEDCYASLAKVKMDSKVSMDSTLNYLVDWEDELEFCGDLKDSLKARKLNAIFIRGIYPKELREIVEDEKTDAWEDTRGVVLAETKKLVDAMKMSKRAKSIIYAHQSREDDQAGRGGRGGSKGGRGGRGGSGSEGFGAGGRGAGGSSGHGSSGAKGSKPEGSAAGGSKPKDEGSPDYSTFQCGRCKEWGHIRKHCTASEDSLRTRSTHPERRPAWQPRAAKKLSSSAKMLVPDALIEEAETDPVVKEAGKEEPSIVPRLYCTMTVMAPDGWERKINAQCDTGSNVDIMSPELYAELDKHGVLSYASQGTVQMLDGSSATPTRCVRSDVMVVPEDVPDLPKVLKFSVDAGVLAMDEEMLLGLPTLQKTGLLKLVVAMLDDGGVAGGEGFDPVDHNSHETVDFDDGRDEVPEGTVWPKLCGTPDEQKQLQVLMEEFAELFGPVPYGGSRLTPMDLELKDGMEPKPIPPRRVSPAVAAIIDENVQKRIAAGWMQPSVSPYASPVVCAPKPGTTEKRVCGDYRATNAALKDVRYPMKNAQATIERMKGKKYFGKADLFKGFHQLRLTKRASELLAIATVHGLFEPTTLPYGPKPGPAIFQQRMSEEAFKGLDGKECEVFVDDVGLAADSFEGFLLQLRHVFERMREYDLRFNGAKCVFGGSEMEFLGQFLNGDGARMTTSRKQGVVAVQTPQDSHQLRSFLGMAGYFRPHIRNYATTVKPLTSVTNKFVWGEAQQQAFERVKEAILDSPMLAFINYELPIRMRTDASQDGIGGMLFQVIDREEMPVAFLSKAFSPAEAKWSTIEQETFAVYYCIINWECYLMGHKFHVETDHKNILWLWKATAPKLVRWRLRLQEHDFDVSHIAGKDNVVADGLSRCHGVLHTPENGQAQRCFKVCSELLADIRKFHSEIVGHRGVHATERLMRDAGYQGADLRETIHWFIQNCPMCQKTRLGQGSVAASLATISVSEPGEEWSIDSLKVRKDDDGYEYVIAAVCGFTRFIYGKAVKAGDFDGKAVNAASAAQFILDLVGIFGLPKAIRSDNGPEYANSVIECLLELLGVARHPGIEYRPQSNGVIERCNREILRHLRCIVLDRRLTRKWSTYLPMVWRVMNATVSSATGTSPAAIMFGGAVNMDRYLLPEKVPTGVKSVLASIMDNKRRLTVGDYVQHLTEAQKCIVDASNKFQEGVIARRIAKSPEQPTEFEYGDWVVASWPDQKKPSKLVSNWRGPYQVIESKGSNAYVVQDPTDLKTMTYSVDRLKKYNMGLTEDPKDIVAVDTDEVLVECIVDHNMPGTKKSDWDFKVRWAGCGPEEDEWLPWKVAQPLAALDEYKRLHPELPL